MYSEFRVPGVDDLRAIYASIFPRVPGAFPAVATYILADKATDFILAEARKKNGDDKILEGIRELEVLEEDRHTNSIISKQAKQEHSV